MGHPDIEKCKGDLVNYVSSNISDYHEIFQLYDAKNCDSHKKNFRDFHSKVSKCKDFSDQKIIKSIEDCKDLFYKIGKCSKLTKHHKVCVLSMNVYLSVLLKCCKKNNNNVCEVNEKYESSKEYSHSTHEQSCSFNEGSVCKLDTKESSCSKSSSSSSNELKCKKSSDKSEESDEKSSCSESSRKSEPCEPCKDVCDTDDEYPFTLSKNCDKNMVFGDENCGFEDCNDIEQLEKISKKLKGILKLICMLNSILCQMQKEFVEKMNTFGVCDSECYINCVDIDFQNKLMFVLYKQIDSLVTQNNCVFNGTKDTQIIKVYLNSGKSFPLGIIDNLKFTLVQDCGKKYILVNIGSKQFKLWFLTDNMTNAGAICVLKQNCCTIKLILHALSSNNKMISHWLEVSKNMAKCKQFCDEKKCENVKKCCDYC